MFRQSPLWGRPVRSAAILAIALHALLGASCSSVYDRATGMLPPEAGERAALRMREADRAAAEARAAGAALGASLGAGDSTRIALDADRLQVRASDLRRRVLSARDAGGIGDEALNRELAAHEKLAADLAGAVAQARAGRAAEAQRLLNQAGVAPTRR